MKPDSRAARQASCDAPEALGPLRTHIQGDSHPAILVNTPACEHERSRGRVDHDRGRVQAMTALAGILGAFGLSGAAGLNAYIPLLLVAILGRVGVIHLAAPFAVITHAAVIAVLAVLLLVEIVVDKVPGADHVNDMVQTFVRPAAGAVLFAAQSGAVAQMHPAVPIVCGLLIAFGVHATKAAARPVVTASTLGVGTPFVSATEDAVSLGASLAAVFAPLVVLAVIVFFAACGYWIWSRWFASKRREA